MSKVTAFSLALTLAPALIAASGAAATNPDAANRKASQASQGALQTIKVVIPAWFH